MPREISPTEHIVNAITSLQKAQIGFGADVGMPGKIIATLGKDLARLEKIVSELRTAAILSDLAAGMSGKETAGKYSLSEARISQIKNA